MAKRNEASELLSTAKRRSFVLALKRSGGTYEQIANAAIKEFGIDALPKGWDSRYAYKDVKRELDRLLKEVKINATAVRELELQRLNEMLRAIWDQVRKGNLNAIDRAASIAKRITELGGGGIGQRLELTGADGEPLNPTIKVVRINVPEESYNENED